MATFFLLPSFFVGGLWLVRELACLNEELWGKFEGFKASFTRAALYLAYLPSFMDSGKREDMAYRGRLKSLLQVA